MLPITLNMHLNNVIKINREYRKCKLLLSNEINRFGAFKHIYKLMGLIRIHRLANRNCHVELSQMRVDSKPSCPRSTHQGIFTFKKFTSFVMSSNIEVKKSAHRKFFK